MFLLTPSSHHHDVGTPDKILNVTNQEISLQSIKDMRRIRSPPAYIELLDCLARAVVEHKVYVETGYQTPCQNGLH